MKEALRGGDAVDDATNDKKRKRSKGRQKIEIKPIEREAARQVSFSKRRSGLFKKAYELSILCGAHVAVIAFSPGNKPFSFIHPSAPSVLDRYLPSQSSQPQQNRLLNDAPTSDAAVSYLSSQLAELTAMLEAAKRRKEELKERVRTLNGNLWIDGDVSRLGWSELNNLQMQLERVKADILARADELFMDGAQFMDVTGIQRNDGVMPLFASSSLVSDYLVPSMTAYPPVDYGFSYDGQIF